MTTERMAKLLGTLGLLPFFGCALVVLLGGALGISADAARAAGITYGAIIAAFMGALHWAYALVAPWRDARMPPMVLVVSVMPALVAWTVLVFAPTPRFAAIGLIATLVWVFSKDMLFRREPWFPAWFLRLRIQLTAGAAFALLILALA